MLSKLQETFLDKYIQSSRYDRLISNKVKLKGKFIENLDDVNELDKSLSEWHLVDVLDSGPGQRLYQCHCGKAIRHQYHIQHSQKDITLKLGSTCYKKYVGIDGDKVAQVIQDQKDLNSEKDEIIDRYVSGYIDKQLFLLDYEALDARFKEQLGLGLPLSSKQEKLAYKDLKIEDEEKILSREKIIKSLTFKQLQQLNNLTKEARQTIIARLVDGRILGVIDEVLATAPELFANHSHGHSKVQHRLKDKLICDLMKENNSPLNHRTKNHYDEIQQFLRLVDLGLEDEVAIVEVARSLLSDQQRDYWGGHTSRVEKIELSRNILTGSNYVEVEDLEDISLIPRRIWQHIKWHLPLTSRMMHHLYGESEKEQ